MGLERADAAEYLTRMAQALELLGAPPREAELHRQAAAALEKVDLPAWEAWIGGRRPAPANMSPAIQKNLLEVARRGAASDLEALLLQLPPGLFDLLELPGLTVAEIRGLWREAGIISPRGLERACRRGQVQCMADFGPAREAELLATVERYRRAGGRWLRIQALGLAAETEALLRDVKGLHELARAGALRRADEIVTELVWVLSSPEPELLLGRLATLEGAQMPEDDTVHVRVMRRPPLRLIVVPPSYFAVRLFLETGSDAHVRAVLMRIADRTAGSADPVDLLRGTPPQSEAAIYDLGKLALVPPELREGRGEVGAAAQGTLPRLIADEDLQGVLHVHSNWSDGKSSLRDVARAADALGFGYLGFADHSPAAFYAHGLTPDRVAQQGKAIRALQPEFPRLRIFHGIECDILPDGDLDLPATVLAQLDYVILSIHSVMQMKREAMTARLIAAMRHPYPCILGHPSGRLLLEREAYPVDWDRLFAAAEQENVAIEFNARGERLDLDWRLLRAATGRGIPICVNPDAHRAEGLECVFEGLATARKGWLTAAQTLNARGPADLAAYFAERRAPASPPPSTAG